MTEEEKRFHEEVAGRLFEMRDAAGMTQEKLAEKAGVQSNSIHRYEVADRKIGLYTAVKVADAAMSKLTERQSEILQLYFYKGMNQYEIAEELGICQQSVNRIMNQAVKRLRKNF